MSGPNSFMAPPSCQIMDDMSYDPETGFFTWNTPPRGRAAIGDRVGSQNPNGYFKVGYQNKLYSAHRLAWMFVHGVWPDHAIDHVNGVRNDNRIANLRRASTSENNRNRRPVVGRLKGVTHVKRIDRFYAFIKADGVRHFLGSYRSEIDAHAAYCEAANRLHGEFARVA